MQWCETPVTAKNEAGAVYRPFCSYLSSLRCKKHCGLHHDRRRNPPWMPGTEAGMTEGIDIPVIIIASWRDFANRSLERKNEKRAELMPETHYFLLSVWLRIFLGHYCAFAEMTNPESHGELTAIMETPRSSLAPGSGKFALNITA